MKWKEEIVRVRLDRREHKERKVNNGKRGNGALQGRYGGEWKRIGRDWVRR